MAHHSVSVVIPVWNQWHFTKVCLETLRPTIGVHDEVIVVDNGSRDETAKALKQFPWVKVITNEENEGFAKGCNKGAAASTKDIICFLNNDTILPSKWLDGLTWVFDDPTIYGSGPRSNAVSGPQCVNPLEANYVTEGMSQFRQWARAWRQNHRGETSDIGRLVGFCVAVRRDKFEEIGGFDEQFEIGGYEDDDLSRRLNAAGGRLVVCHESFVHHVGHVTFEGNGLDWKSTELDNKERFLAKHGIDAPRVTGKDEQLLSACMIVKDEIDNLERCLTSLNSVVDEVVIYDTGSTDGSIEFARAAGATVIEGYWDDDFGRARNAALEACSGEWVLQVDADEVFEGHARALRDHLMTTSASALQVEILNLSDGDKNNLTHRPCRLFKREIFHWVGRIHEQVTMRDGKLRDDFGVAPWLRLTHYGYLSEAMESKKKGERNIRIARIDANSDNDRDEVDKLSNLGRSLMLTGQNEEALSLFTRARAMTTDSPVIKRTLYRSAAQASIAVERPEESLSWIEELSAASEHQDTSHYFRCIAYCDLKQWEAGLEQFDRLHSPMRDDDGVVFPIFVVNVRRAQALAGLERWDEAADAALEFAKDNAVDEPVWGFVAETFWRAGRSMDDLFTALPAEHLPSVFGQLTTAIPEAADVALESLWKFEDRRSSVLALAIRLAPKLALERCLEWSARLREYNLSEHCPLITAAFDTTLTSSHRLKCAAIAITAFSDQRAEGAMVLVASTFPIEWFGQALKELNQLAPALLGSFVTSASTDASRSFAMAKALHGLGAGDEAVAVLMHGMNKDMTSQSIADDAAAWLESVGHAQEAAGIRTGKGA